MSNLKFISQKQKFKFNETDGLKIIDYGLMSLDQDKLGENTVKIRYKREDFTRLKQHIDAILEKQKDTPEDWRSFAMEQLPYLSRCQDDLMSSEFVNELQRSSDFLNMLLATDEDSFCVM